MKDFVHIHNHTSIGSMLDALQSVDDLFDLVNLKGQKALAITDHGTLASFYDAYRAYKRTGVKFIPGIEAYFVHSYDVIESQKRRKTERRKHIVLLAQNETGYKNLLKLNYFGFKNYVVSMGRSFSRISWDLLEQHNEGLIATSACGNGILAERIINGEYDEAVEYAKKLSNIFKDRFYLEIQPHALKSGDFEQLDLNEQLIEMSNELKLPLVVGCDSHYLSKADAKVHDVLLAINARKPVDDPNRHRYGIDEFYVKDCDEVYRFLEKHHGKDIAEEAIDNTVKIANMCDAPDYMEPKGNHLPVFDPTRESDYGKFVEWSEKSKIPQSLPIDKAYMRFKIIEGFKEKFGHFGVDERKKRWERVKHELKVLEGNNFSSYMLITADMIKWAKINGILSGTGRGCTTKDTMVLTECGFKNINKIKIGDKVYSHTGKLRSVIDNFEYNVDEYGIEIQTKYSFGKLCFTKDHELLVSKKKETEEGKLFRKIGSHKHYTHYVRGDKLEWIKVDKIENGDYIFMPFINRPISVENRIDLANFVPNSYNVCSDYIEKKYYKNRKISNRKISIGTGLMELTIANYKRSKKYNKRIDLFLRNNDINYNDWISETDIIKYNRFIPINEDFYYILGRWVGDGFIKEDNKKTYSYYIGFSCNKNDKYGIERIRRFFSDMNFVTTVREKIEKCVEVCVYDRVLVNLLRHLFPDYKNSSYTKYLGEFRKLPNNFLLSMIKGLIDSDGYVRGKTKQVTSSSDRLVEELREVCMYLRIPSSVVFRKGGEWETGGRKFNRKNSYDIRFDYEKLSEVRNRNITENGYFSKVVDIYKKYVDKVYDISVEKDNSYITQNYASHNSVGGSLIAYLLDIHRVDPLKYGLLFERFQNAYKKDLPDIDTDFTSSGRDKVKAYVRNKYGIDNCAQVSNINTYTPKNVIPDLVKSMRNIMPELVPEGTHYVRVAEDIKAVIPDLDQNGKGVKTLQRAMELSPKLRKFAEKCPELMRYADKIVGMPKEFSTHAAGAVVSDRPIYEFSPLRIDKNGVVATQYDKDKCETEGLVKMDFLAIATLDIIDETLKNMRRLGINKSIDDIENDLDDKEVYKTMQQGHTKCVFQLGKTGSVISLCKRIKPKNIMDVAMVNALARPSAKDTKEEYIDRRFGKTKITYPHVSLKEPLDETYGIAVTEEQLMGIARCVAGWDLNKADGLRKFTKLKGKKPELALKLEAEFIEGMMKEHDVKYELAKDVWDKFVSKFSGYGFNLSHAVFNAINGYITAYLKHYYPAAFMAAYLKVKTEKGGLNREDEINGAKSECGRLGIKIVPPDINRSKSGYEILDEETIVMGLSAIKGMGDKAVNEIINKQDFSSFVDFLYRIDGRVVNKSKIEVLSKAGCFDSFCISRKGVCDEGKKIRDKMNAFLRKRVKDGYDMDMAIDDFQFQLPSDEWTKQQKLRHERDVLGELISGNTNDLFPGFFTKNNITPISRLISLPHGHKVLVEVIPKTLREFKLKSGKSAGRNMMKYTVEDINRSETELTIWPDNKFKEKVAIGNPIGAICEVNEYNGIKALTLKKITKVYGG